jgi:hypothetical protein
MLSDLEILRAARASVLDPASRWDFADFRACTCGHIYRGATGDYASEMQDVWPPYEPGLERPADPVYARAILTVAAALGWDGNLRAEETWRMYAFARAESAAASYVSDYTLTGVDTDAGEDVEREHAVRVLDEAIAAIEQADRAAMLAVCRSPHDHDLPR